MIKEEWKIFCRTLYANVLRVEKGIDTQLEQSFRMNKPFSDRQRLLNKIKFCSEYKQKIIDSVANREFELQDGDVEIIESKGYTYYFKYLDCRL